MKVTATTSRFPNEVMEVLNPGDNYGQAYMIEIGCGFSSSFFVVEADNESDAIDEFTDSKYGHMIRVEDDDPARADYDEENSTYAGNAGELVDLDHVMIYRCELVYRCERIPNGVASTEYRKEIEILDEMDSIKVERYKDIPTGRYFSVCVDKKEYTYATFHKLPDGTLIIDEPMPHINMNTYVPDDNSLWFLCEDYEYRRPA